MKRCGACAVLLFILAMLTMQTATAAQQSATIARAKSEAAAGNYSRAAELYQQVLKENPNSVAALRGLVDVLVAAGKWQAALSPLRQLVQLEPKDANRLFQLGQMESWQGHRAQALSFLARAAKVDPSNSQYQESYAEVLSWNESGRDQAIQILRSVVASHPDDAHARRLLARTLAAEHHPAQAAAVLAPAVQSSKASAEDLWTQGQLNESEGKNAAAIADYRRALARDPNHVKSIESLAPMLSWNAATRPEAGTLFQHGLQLAPNDLNLLIPYAEMLSWSRATRAQSMQLYQKALAQDPHNAQALTGEAQLLSWTGHSGRALQIYSQVLAEDPDNVAALTGKAQILGWRGEHRQALNLAQQAHGLDESNSAATLELARAEYDVRDYAAARDDLAQVKGIDTPDYFQLKRDVNHALGAYFEFGYAMRRDGKRLDYDTADALVSVPLGTENRLSAMYQPLLYRTQQRNFNSNYYALMLDSRPSETVSTHAEVAGRTYPGAPTQMEGGFDAAFAVRPSFTLQMGFDRAADEETLVSTLGAYVNGIFVGQVETNLASIGGSYSNSRHHYDASLTYTDGFYTGENLASNRRWSVDGNFGKSIRGSHPYIRAAYGFTYLSFDHDAEFEPGSGAPVRVTGGYYSPTRYLLNYAQLFFSGNFGSRAKWDFGGFAGAQNADTEFTSFSNPQFASTFSAHFIWEAGAKDEFRFAYDYLNTFNAFHRHLFFVTWRHYF